MGCVSEQGTRPHGNNGIRGNNDCEDEAKARGLVDTECSPRSHQLPRLILN